MNRLARYVKFVVREGGVVLVYMRSTRFVVRLQVSGHAMAHFLSTCPYTPTAPAGRAVHFM